MQSTPRWTFLAALLVALGTAAAALGQCPPPTQPYAPPSGSTTTETRIDFAWSPAGSGVTGYDLFLSQNGGPVTRPCFNSPSPNCTTTLSPAHYDWYVRSYTLDCLGGTASPHSTFDIVGCSTPVAPATLTPDNGVQTAASGVTLSWSGGSADTWDVFLDQGSNCTTTTPLNATPLPSATTSIVTGALSRGSTYAWRVRASRGSTCPAPQLSKCATFSVRTCDPPGTPILQQPQDGATGVPQVVNLAWAAAAGAAGYNVWARTGSSDPFALAGATTGTSLKGTFPPSARVEWYVDALNGSCSTSSAHQTFTVAGCPGGTPTPLSPVGTLTPGTPIAFSWSTAGADRYRLWLAPAGGTFVSIEETSDFTFTAHRPAGTYDWYVEAIRNNCPSTRSVTNRFVVPQANCTPAPPTLQSPADGTTLSGPVTFNWTVVPNAARYEVWASLGNAAPARIGTITSPVLTTDLAPGLVRWYVVALRDGCDNLQSARANVNVTRALACLTAPPLLIAPADEAQQLPTNVDFFWTNVSGAQQYKLWVAVDDGDATVLATTTSTRAQVSVPRGRVVWFVEATFGSCGSRRSAAAAFRSNAPGDCTTPAAPLISVPAGAPSGIPYEVHWTPLPNVDHYDVFESTDATLATPSLTKTSDVIFATSHAVTTSTRYHYRVRAVSSCGAGEGPLSAEASVLVEPTGNSTQTTVPFGTGNAFTRTLFVPGQGAPIPFTAASDRPWLVIIPSSGTLPPQGITLTLQADLSALDAGDSVATIRINTTPAGTSAWRPVQPNGSSTSPVSITLVTPVTPGGKSAAPSGALILPAVAHIDGLATFQSDIRLANTGPRPLRYQLTFTKSGTDATKSAQQTFLQVESGATIALNDLLKNFFGAAGATSGATGSLEIKQVNATSDSSSPVSVSFASSRTYTVTPNGTSGQFIPALPLSRFAGVATPGLLVPQISQAGAFRTNIGLVEASAQPAHAVLSFFDAAGILLSQIHVDLQPGEHRQLNGVVTSSGTLSNAVRMLLNVTSSTGLVTAYASVLDAVTSDPMLIDAVPVNAAGAKRYVVPGIASLDAGGGNHWRSDVRVFNNGSSPQTMTVTFTPQGAPAQAQSAPFTLGVGEVRALDDILRGTFGTDNVGGSIAVTTSDASQLAVTARTYFATANGTFGQFIPAFTESSGSGPGERAQQILQVEQSDRFRTNLGLVELSGNPATVEVTAFAPEMKVQSTVTLSLGPNEYVQYGSILAQLGLPNIYNARLAVRVTSAQGRVAGYGCLIDNISGDPTYVPSQ
jgi:hypothetical protein